MDFKSLITRFIIAESDGCVVASFPIIMDMDPNNSTLNIGIFEAEDEYTLVNDGSMFDESGMSAKDCYNKFTEAGKCNYEIKYENGLFTKSYKKNQNPVFALDEFIKFFVTFNEYVMGEYSTSLYAFDE